MKYESLQIIHELLVQADQLAFEEYQNRCERVEKLDKQLQGTNLESERLKLELELEKAIKERKASNSKRGTIKAALDDFEAKDWR